MPMRTKRTYKKKSYRKKRTPIKRKNNIAGSRRPNTNKSFSNSKIFWYKQSCSGGSIASIASNTLTQTTSLQNLSWLFRISDVPNAINFKTIYEQYRINKIVVKFIPMASQVVQNTVSTGGAVSAGILATVLDWSNSSTLAFLSDYEQYQNFKFQGVFSRREHTRIFKPSIIENAQAGTGVGQVVAKNKWLSFTDTETNHFGIKIYLDAAPDTTVSQSFWVQCKFYVAFKNVK